jgi:hypothetical protein
MTPAQAKQAFAKAGEHAVDAIGSRVDATQRGPSLRVSWEAG